MAHPEDALQADVTALFERVGFEVYDFSQGYRKEPGGTRQTPGPTDLEGWHVKAQLLVKFEVKTTDGLILHARMLALPHRAVKPYQLKDWTRAQNQHRYGTLCRACQIPYAMGGMPEARALLVSIGLARFDGTQLILTPQGGRRMGIQPQQASA